MPLSEYWKIRVAETVTCPNCFRIRSPYHWILKKLGMCDDCHW